MTHMIIIKFVCLDLNMSITLDLLERHDSESVSKWVRWGTWKGRQFIFFQLFSSSLLYSSRLARNAQQSQTNSQFRRQLNAQLVCLTETFLCIVYADFYVQSSMLTRILIVMSLFMIQGQIIWKKVKEFIIWFCEFGQFLCTVGMS